MVSELNFAHWKCDFQHMQILDFGPKILNGQKMDLYGQILNSETILCDNMGIKWVGRSPQIKVSTSGSVFFRYPKLGKNGHFGVPEKHTSRGRNFNLR